MLFRRQKKGEGRKGGKGEEEERKGVRERGRRGKATLLLENKFPNNYYRRQKFTLKRNPNPNKS